MDEAQLREALTHQTDLLNRIYRHVGQITDRDFGLLEEVARVLPEGEVAGRYRHFLHDLASARLSLELERREADQIRRELQNARQARKERGV